VDYNILAINPGSTSTKIAVYENETELFTTNIVHPQEELDKISSINEQFGYRKNVILDYLRDKGFELSKLSAVVGRGGMLPPVKSGSYKVNDLMVDTLSNRPSIQHASNLGGPIAYEIAKSVGVEAYIYDSPRVDELIDIARISGLKEIPRTSTVHTLNSRAMAIKYAKSIGKAYSDLNLVVAHLGGGISLSCHEHGQMVDIVSDDEGPFSPERAGRVPCSKLVDLCYSGEYTQKELHKLLRGKGGLKSYLNTADAREVERRANEGDEYAKTVYEAMAYQVAKSIGEMATVVSGDVDAIILTGGIAYSKMFTDFITNRVKFISKVVVLPGENEMESLAYGVLRVLKGEETAREYTEE